MSLAVKLNAAFHGIQHPPQAPTILAALKKADGFAALPQVVVKKLEAVATPAAVLSAPSGVLQAS